MKRILLPLLLLAVMFSMWQHVPAIAQNAVVWAIVNNPNPEDRLHLREKPDTASASLGRYYNGTVAECIPGFEHEAWAYVSIGSRSGYMQKQFLAIGAEPGSVQAAQPLMVVNNESAASWLNLREEPSQNSRVLGQFFNGKRVTVLGELEDWLHVVVDGTVGFMMPAFLRQAEQHEVVVVLPSAEPIKLRQYEAFAAMDPGYSVSASAIEVSPSVFHVHTNIAFTPDYTTNDDIMRYALYINGIRIAYLDAVQASGNMLLAPTAFTASVTIDERIQTIVLVPILEEGGEQAHCSVTLIEVIR